MRPRTLIVEDVETFARHYDNAVRGMAEERKGLLRIGDFENIQVRSVEGASREIENASRSFDQIGRAHV